MCAINDLKTLREWKAARREKGTTTITGWKIVSTRGTSWTYSHQYRPGLNIAEDGECQPLPEDYVYGRVSTCGVHFYLSPPKRDVQLLSNCTGLRSMRVVPVRVQVSDVIALEKPPRRGRCCRIRRQAVARQVTIERDAWERAGVSFEVGLREGWSCSEEENNDER